MSDLREIRNSIESSENLQSVVGIMKAYASGNIIRFQNAARSSADYRKALDKAVYVVMRHYRQPEYVFPGKKSGTIHIVIGSDHGLAGRFNERINSFAFGEIGHNPGDHVFVVGQQVIYRMPSGHEAAEVFQSAQTDEGITSVVQEILLAVEKYRRRGDFDRIMIYYNRPSEGIFFEERSEQLFPLNFEGIAAKTEKWGTRALPVYLVDRQEIFTHLVRQYLFITLYRNLCYSLAAENASRLASMQAAEKNIEERLNELRFAYRQERQNSITEEINDVVSGFRATKKMKA